MFYPAIYGATTLNASQRSFWKHLIGFSHGVVEFAYLAKVADRVSTSKGFESAEHRAGYDDLVRQYSQLDSPADPTDPEQMGIYERNRGAFEFADWIFEPGKWVFPEGIADDYAFSQWLEERVTPAPEFSQVGTFNYAWRPIGTDAWRFWHGPDPKGRDTTDINSAKIRETRATIINQPFMLDGEKVQSVPMVDQLAVVTQAVNLYRDRPGSEWRPIEVLDADRVLTRLDTLAEAVDFCQQNINHSLALHAARVWVEAEVERKSAIREAQFAGYETLTVDQAQVFQDTAETVDEEWRFYDIREAVKTRMAYNLEHAEVVHADPDKVLQQAKELVESVAAARRRWIVGALDEQASHIDGSCPSQQNALTGLALVKQEALRELDRSEEDGITRIRAVRDTYLDRIRRYEVLHSPIWSVRGVQDSGIARFDWTPVNATSAGDDIPLGLPIAVANPDVDETNFGNIAVGLEFPDGEVGVQQPFTINRKPRPNGQVVVKLRGGLPDDTPPFGRHRMRLTARNECGPSDLLVDILRREPMVSDPGFETLDHTTPAWTWTAGTPETVAVTPPDGVERKGLRLVDNDDQQERLFYSGLMPVDHSAEYQVSVSAKQPTGDRIGYLFVEFFEDSAGKIPMNLQWYEADKKARQVPAGWAGVGSFFYWGVAGFQFPTDWTHYAMTFGRDGKADIPPEAQAMRVGAILAWTGTSETEVLLTDYQCTKV